MDQLQDEMNRGQLFKDQPIRMSWPNWTHQVTPSYANTTPLSHTEQKEYCEDLGQKALEAIPFTTHSQLCTLFPSFHLHLNMIHHPGDAYKARHVYLDICLVRSSIITVSAKCPTMRCRYRPAKVMSMSWKDAMKEKGHWSIWWP